MSKYFEIVPITDLPEKDGWYIRCYSDGRPFIDEFRFKDGQWTDDIPTLTHWLREVSSLPIDKEQAEKIASEAWDAAMEYGMDIWQRPSHKIPTNPDKEEYLKQFQ